MKPSGVALLASASVAAAHMEMTWPPPFRSKYNPFSSPGAIDYTMTAPLLADGSNFPCKNYHTADLGTAAGRPTASFAAGQPANLSIAGGAIHGGGSCQVSLSYDRGHSFTVVQSIEGGCPASAGTARIDFSIPFDAPAGDALLAWTWFNNLGNREMYMNCAPVTIAGAPGASRQLRRARRATHTPLSARPKLFVANVGNGCSTVDSTDVQFPQPGPDVAVQSSKGAVAPRGSGCQNGDGAVSYASNSGQPSNSGAAAQQAVPAAAASASASPAPVAAAPAAPAIPSPNASKPQPAAAVVEPSAAGSAVGDTIAAGTACSTEGRWSCLNGGTAFQRCASGRWSAVQAMAAGTVCRVGQSDTTFDIETAPAVAGAPLK